MNLESLLERVDVVLITDRPTYRWLTGFSGEEGVLVVGQGFKRLLVDSRFTEQARLEVAGAEVVEYKPPITDYLKAEKLLQGRFGVNGRSVTYKLAKDLMDGGVELIDLSEEILHLRSVKCEEEITNLRKAIEIAESAFLKALTLLKPGITEKDFAAELEYQARKLGSEGMAFDTIVASGWRGALPHGVASDKKIELGELVVVDWGCVWKGYHSDLTRTVAVGQIGADEMSHLRNVLEAHERAANAITFSFGSDLDKIARDYLAEKGLADYFGHGLGHGIGLEIHEYPVISQRVQHELRGGQVFTIEPGIYFPGRYGIRIEDDYLYEGTGLLRLSRLEQLIMV
ncbi:M24 family metallopeptidase [Coprothermobacteraceae bacterium]|nr:M24 family metallopeptidase [Coprothermobacteraceae bacterium]